jgi:hypothetical protein
MTSSAERGQAQRPSLRTRYGHCVTEVIDEGSGACVAVIDGCVSLARDTVVQVDPGDGPVRTGRVSSVELVLGQGGPARLQVLVGEWLHSDSHEAR